MFHAGHISFFQKAKSFGAKLIVGICSDEDVESYKRKPILPLEYRAAVISSCSLVNDIIMAAPPATDKAFMQKYDIDLVAASSDYCEDTLKKFYSYPLSIGALKLVDYMDGISTTDIILKCHARVKASNGNLGSLS